jgi:hypothetical protein
MATKTFVKVYFNNGCTTLIYNESTTIDDLIRLVIKGRLSLNELRYRHCFRLKSTKLATPFKDFDPLLGSSTLTLPALTTNESNSAASLSNSTALINAKLNELFWLRDDMTVKEWLHLIGHGTDESALDFWKLQLKVRCMSGDLNEVKFKDPITFGYFYDQINNEFMHGMAPEIADPDLVPVLIKLGCLEMKFVLFIYWIYFNLLKKMFCE